MNSSPKQPADKEKKPDVHLPQATKQHLEHILSIPTTETQEAPSLGETLLPFLFAAMETCWLDAIFIGLAGFGLFQPHAPLMPLWAPFVFIAGSQWLFAVLNRRAATTTPASSSSLDEEDNTKTVLPGSSFFILFMSLTTLFIIWLSLYTQTSFFLDPRWLPSMLNDILLLNIQAYHVFVIVAFSLYLCWRGIRLLYNEHEPSQAFNVLRLGMGVIVAVIVIRASQVGSGASSNDDITLLLIIPLFLFFSLAAHALARVTFVRHTHAFGLEEGNSDPQERAILLIIGMVGIALLFLTWLVETIASPALFADTQHVFAALGTIYDWLITGFAIILVFLATPLFWLIDWFTHRFPPRLPTGSNNGNHGRTPNHLPPRPAAAPEVVIVFLKFLIPILLILLAVLLVRWAIRRRGHVRIVARRRVEELHESLWSWMLFWTQFKGIFRALFARFFPHRTEQEQKQTSMEETQSEPTARSMREIYRALLKHAANRGYPRKKDETPYEFRRRLNEKTPLAEPQLALITEAYTATRYSGIPPGDAEVMQVQREWTELEQKWREA